MIFYLIRDLLIKRIKMKKGYTLKMPLYFATGMICNVETLSNFNLESGKPTTRVNNSGNNFSDEIMRFRSFNRTNRFGLKISGYLKKILYSLNRHGNNLTNLKATNH